MESYIIDTPQFHLTEMEFVIRLIVATGIGLLIGLEREHEAIIRKENIFAGFRTFIILTLVGFVGAGLSFLISPLVFSTVLFGAIILIGISYWVTATKGEIGGTSEVTAILAVLLGGLTFVGYIELSLMIMVILVVLLSSKPRLQFLIGKITNEELFAFIRFVVIALLIFPFLPDTTYGPFNVFNPHEIGLVILLISGLGFLGYVMMRIFGAGRGIFLTGIIGGIVSSTMVTWVFSKKSKELPSLSSSCATAIFAACTIMVIRVMIWVFIFNSTLAPGLIIPFGIVFLVTMGVTVYYYFMDKRKPKVEAEIPLGKPLNLGTALFFGLVFVAVLFIVAYANQYFGEKGIYITSGIAGLSEVDAITISVLKLANVSISILTAQNAILLATISNTIVKIVIALWTGSAELRKYIFIGYGLIFFAAMIGFLLLNL
ncbi:MAG: MgtC/SapB family protein [Saprospiraceae bacterium]